MSNRDLIVHKKFKLSEFLTRWEMILVYLFIAINLMLLISRPNLYFADGTITSIIQSGMDVAPMVLSMLMILLLGEIDISIASIMILSAMVVGFACQNGIPVIVAVLLGLLTGVGCGCLNSTLIGYAKMPSIIATLATQMLYRGLVEAILNTATLNVFPTFYVEAANGTILGIPNSMLIFIVLTLIFFWIVHKSDFGRKVYLVGNNITAAEYSGINVKKIYYEVYIIMGVMAVVSSMLFVGRMGSGISPSMGTGYEMNVIAICVLGGVSPNGGTGKIYGPFIGTFIMAFLIYSLGIMGVEANTRKIIIGLILLIAVTIPKIKESVHSISRKKAQASA